MGLTLVDIDVLELAIVEQKPVLVIVDPIIAFMAGRDTHKASEVRGVLAPLAALAEKHRCSVLAVRHLNKAAIRALYRGQGSIDFLAACRSSFLVGKDPDNPLQRVICHVKSNLAPETPSLTFSIAEGRFLWGGESSLTPEQVLAVPADGQEKSRLDSAKEFLNDLLAEAPVPAKTVLKSAEMSCVSERTLNRAKEALGIKPRRIGGLGESGQWFWELPKMSKDPLRCPPNNVGILGKTGHISDGKDGWEEDLYE